MTDRTGPAAGSHGRATIPPPGDWVLRAVARYERPLISYVAHLAGDVERARDVVQETFVRLCGAAREDVEPRLAQWLFTVSRNLAIDARRKERRMHRMNDTETGSLRLAGGASGATFAPDPADAAARGDAVSQVLRYLADLPPVQQEVIRLKFQHGLSYREIGEVLNLTATNVGFLIHTGLKTVRRRLSDSEPAARTGA